MSESKSNLGQISFQVYARLMFLYSIMSNLCQKSSQTYDCQVIRCINSLVGITSIKVFAFGNEFLNFEPNVIKISNGKAVPMKSSTSEGLRTAPAGAGAASPGRPAGRLSKGPT